MARYKREATCGNVTLNSSRKGGNTLTYWYYINMGKASCGRDKWIEFDVRDLAAKAGAELPQLMTCEEMSACGDSSDAFENLLQRDLQRVADWCASIDAVSILSNA